MSFVFGGGSKLNLFGFNFNDNVVYPDVATLGWETTGGGANFTLVPPTSNLIINGMVGGSTYNISLDEEVDKPRRSSITSYSAALNFYLFLENKNELQYGFDFTGLNINLEFINLFNRTFKQDGFPSEIAAFVKYRHVLGDLVIEPSFEVTIL